jgi:hypothetical protein
MKLAGFRNVPLIQTHVVHVIIQTHPSTESAHRYKPELVMLRRCGMWTERWPDQSSEEVQIQ